MPSVGLRIGLTGGIGSGKSTVAARLAALGALLVDTDAIARELTAPGGAAMAQIASKFGSQAVHAAGGLDRDYMRRIAFGDSSVKRHLEALLHPLIGAEALARAAAAGHRPVVFDVPLLAESANWRSRVRRVLVVDCSRETQIERVMRRSGWAADAVARVIDQQAPRERRRAVADAVIHNEMLSLEALNAQVDTLWAYWTVEAV